MAALSNKYRAYPEYKDSGIEFLQSVPFEWNVTALKHTFLLNPSKNNLDGNLLDKVCSFVPMEKLKLNSLVLDEEKIVRDVFAGYTYFQDHDILMAKVTPCFENKNISVAENLTNGIGFGSSEIYVIRANEAFDNRYLYYRLQEDIFMQAAISNMTGAGGLKRVPSEFINDYRVAIPEKWEQTKIAQFLDHETTKIDQLIEKQQKLIKLLEEKRQAVISHAVTKGLDPNVEMKDSGIEWLGKIPWHWDISKLNLVASKIGDGLHSTPKYEDETGYYFINGNNLSYGSIKFNNATKEVPYKEFIKYKNDLNESTVFLSINGTIGNVALYNDEPIILGKSAAYINCKIGLNRKYLALFLQTSQVEKFYNLEKTGTTIYNLSLMSIRNMKVPIPTLNEQLKIISYCHFNIEKYNNILNENNSLIKLLKERRTVLISAAVTGKIDVRDWEMPES